MQQDDTERLQAMLDRGEPVRLDPRIYRTCRVLRLTADTTLRAEGATIEAAHHGPVIDCGHHRIDCSGVTIRYA